MMTEREELLALRELIVKLQSELPALQALRLSIRKTLESGDILLNDLGTMPERYLPPSVLDNAVALKDALSDLRRDFIS